MAVPRQITVKGDLAFVPLSGGKEALIDAADLSLVEGHNWHAHGTRSGFYAGRTDYRDGVKRKVLLHRVILPTAGGLVVDHINGNGLDCRRSNLRAATHAQNRCNVPAQKRNKSGLKGVVPHHGKWRAQLTVDGKTIRFGSFKTPEEAYAVFTEQAARYRGEFAHQG